MKKRIRIAGMILSHVGLLLSVLYLIFFAVCTVKASSVSDSEINAAESDLYLKQAMSDRDFSLFTVGKALSQNSDSDRENVLIVADLVIPMLCIASGVLLQIGATHPKRKRPIQAQHVPSQSSTVRR